MAIAPSSVVVPPAEAGTSSNWLGSPASVLVASPSLNVSLGIGLSVAITFDLESPLKVPFKTPVTVSGVKSVSVVPLKAEGNTVKLNGVFM